MSEVLNAEVDDREAKGLSRRRVVAGVAWSVPVIMTTVAVPPASASPGHVDALLDPNSAIKLVLSTKAGAPGQARDGSGPKGFYVKNSGGVSTGAISGRIAVSSSDSSAPQVGIQALSSAALDQPGASATGFNIPAGVNAGANTFFTLTFNYTEPPKNWVGPKSFQLTITFTAPLGLQTQILGGALELK